MKAQKDVRENLVFMPFEFSSLVELESWIKKDTQAEIKAVFGSKVNKFEDIKLQITSTLLDEPNWVSMMVTIRTSYRQLINIGYVLLTQKRQNGRKLCYIEYLYLNRAFREKDYEYRVLKKAVEFALKELQCDSCFIWIYKSNYLFLSIAKTLSFRLVKTEPDNLNNSTRHCYAISLPSNYNKVPTEKIVKSPDMSIPNYLHLKKNLLKMNSEQKVGKGTFKRKEGVFYSPILKSETIKCLQDNKHNIPSTINSASVRNSRTTKNVCNTRSDIVKYDKVKVNRNKDRETSSTTKINGKYQKIPSI